MRMKNIRQIHLIMGTFFAPAIIFFAFSGILQIFGLHVSRGEGSAPPAAWIAQLAAIHKNQHVRAESRGRDQARHVHDEHDGHDHGDGVKTQEPTNASWGLKAFVLLMATGLIATSLAGITLALQNPRTRRSALISFALGIALPLLLMFI
jgi:hypothetical protein